MRNPVFLGSKGADKFTEAKSNFDSAYGGVSTSEGIPLYPTDENRDAKTKALNDYREGIGELSGLFDSYRPEKLEPITPQEFTVNLKAATDEVTKAFEDAGTEVPDGFFMGFEAYRDQLANGGATAVLDYQLNGIKHALLDLAEARPSALVKMFREGIPEETGTAYSPASGEVARNFGLEVAFRGSEQTAREFLTSLGDTKPNYYIVRCVSVTNDRDTPPKVSDAKFESDIKKAAAATEAADPFGGAFVLPGADDEEPAEEEPASDEAPEDEVAEEEAAPVAETMDRDTGRILAQVLGSEEVTVFVRFDLSLFAPSKSSRNLDSNPINNMSWISENYEKAALGGAAVVALGLAFVGWQKLGSAEQEFSSVPKGDGPRDASVKQADAVPVAIASFHLDRKVLKPDDNGRPVDLFTGVPLFVNKNDLNNPVDLNGKGVDPVHPPIPNSWWIDNRIDPGFGDSPMRDADDDGFSNLAEFEGKTDPNDKRSYPPLITKLTFAGDEAVKWVLRPGYPGADGGYTFTYDDTLGRSDKTGAANPIPSGELFFKDGPIKNRFKYLSAETRKELNERMNVEVDVTFVTVEDQKANKLGTKYEVPANFRKANANQFAQFDRTAVMTLEALGLAGQEFKVEENTAFALPPGSEEKNFMLKSVSPESITVEVTGADGAKKSYDIRKGATGPETP